MSRTLNIIFKIKEIFGANSVECFKFWSTVMNIYNLTQKLRARLERRKSLSKVLPSPIFLYFIGRLEPVRLYIYIVLRFFNNL